jgi:CubicO group peptidase (beta-lactamase class C family)
MNKVLYIVIFLIAVFLVQGIYYVLASKSTILYKVFGAAFIALSIFLVFFTNLTFGIQEKDMAQYHQLEVDSSLSKSHDLHNAVVEAVLPLTKNRIGFVVASVANGHFDLTAFGSTSLRSNASIPQRDTLFEIGSVTKVFTATALAKLEQESILSLNNTVSRYVPDTQRLAGEKAQITLRNLVTHTSGLPRMGASVFRPSRLWNIISGGNPYEGYSQSQVHEMYGKVRLQSSPGKKIEYSNLGYGLLATILCQKADTTYSNLIQNTIARPLGLKDTMVELSASQQMRMASGYQGYLRLGDYYLAQKSDPWDFSPGMVGAGGLRSSGQDMLLFLQANMANKTPETCHPCTQAHKVLQETDEQRIGMGWFRKKLPGFQTEIIYHNGVTGGYAAFIAMTADYEYGVAVLSNTSEPADPLGQAVLSRLVASFRPATGE